MKLDKSFIQKLSASERDAPVVKATLELARNPGVDMIAEGVEDAETLHYLRKIDCHVVQGFFLCKPISTAEFNERLAEHYVAESLSGNCVPFKQLTRNTEAQRKAG